MGSKLLTDSNQINRDEWNEFLAKGLFASPFQSPEYFDSLSKDKVSGASVFALSDSGQIKVLMVVAIMNETGLFGPFSRRGIIFGGPVIGSATMDELTFFLEESVKLLRGKVIYLETRNFFDYSLYSDSFLKSKWTYHPYLDILIDLQEIKKDELLSSFKYNRRREIKQSISNGAISHLTERKEDILAVYKILEKLYRETVKLPLPSFEFFYAFFETNVMKVFAVKHGEKVIGGSFCPVLKGKGLYTFYYCGLRDYHKRIFPTHLAILAALEYAVDNNIPTVDFMGAGKPDLDYGV